MNGADRECTFSIPVFLEREKFGADQAAVDRCECFSV